MNYLERDIYPDIFITYAIEISMRRTVNRFSSDKTFFLFSSGESSRGYIFIVLQRKQPLAMLIEEKS